MDTNNWIYLANSKNPVTNSHEDGHHFKLFSLLKEKIEEKKVELLICEIIEKEWANNKVHTESLIKEYQNKIKEHGRVVGLIQQKLEDHIDKEVLQGLFNKYQSTLEKKIEENKTHIQQVEDLMSKAKRYPIRKKTKIFTTDWALEKKAPFIGDKRNSTADALILFDAINHLKDISRVDFPDEDDFIYDYPVSVFVSGNTGDFSVSKLNPKVIHGDLRGLLEGVAMRFFISLPEALNFISERIIFDQVEMDRIEEEMRDLHEYIESNRTTCEVCDPEEDYEYLNFVEFSEPYQIDHDDYNPRQLEIAFPPPSNGNNFSPRKTLTIQAGKCNWCGAEHIKCGCGEIITEQTDFKCEECQIQYIFVTYYDGDGEHDETIRFNYANELEDEEGLSN